MKQEDSYQCESLFFQGAFGLSILLHHHFEMRVTCTASFSHVLFQGLFAYLLVRFMSMCIGSQVGAPFVCVCVSVDTKSHSSAHSLCVVQCAGSVDQL